MADQHLDTFLAAPHQVNAIAAHALKTGLFKPKDYEAAGQFYWQQAALHNISWAGYALPSGELVGAGNWIAAQGISIAELSSRTGQHLFNYSTDAAGNRIKQIQIDDYAPTSDTWYTNTEKAGQPIWSPIYAAPGLEDYITVSATYPVYTVDQQLQAVLVVDLLLSSISQFLDQLEISPSAQVFITDRQGWLVGSTDASRYPIVSDHPGDARLQAIESTNPLVQSAAQYLQQHFGSFDAISGAQNLTFKLANTRQFLRVALWQDQRDLEWLVVTVVPESDFLAQIKASNRITVGLCLFALLVATGLGVLTAQWISRPIARLSQASASLASAAQQHTLDQHTQTCTPSASRQTVLSVVSSGRNYLCD